MAVLSDFQFDLSDVVFGIGADVTVEDEGFDPGTAEWTVQDAEQPQTDAIIFGRDYLRPPVWAWTLSTDMDDETTALAALAKLAAVWRGLGARYTPGAVLALRYQIAGRTRRVYGRPRRFTSPPTNRILGGYIPIVCDFQCVDAYHYADTEGSATISTFSMPNSVVTNLLANPSFEGTVTNASVTGGTYALSSAQAYVGSQSVSGTKTGTAGLLTFLAGGTPLAVTAGEMHSAGAYIYSGISRSVTASISWRDSANAVISTTSGTPTTTTANGWKRIVVEGAVAPALAVSAYVTLALSAVALSEVHYMDAAMIQKAATLASYVEGTETTTGGFVFALKFPARTLPSGSRAGQIYSNGDLPTWPVLKVNGPVTDPTITSNAGWKLSMTTELTAGQSITIDTRPWQRTVMRGTSSNASGTLSRNDRLANAKIYPGDQEISLSGSTNASGGSLEITWRDCFASL